MLCLQICFKEIMLLVSPPTSLYCFVIMLANKCFILYNMDWLTIQIFFPSQFTHVFVKHRSIFVYALLFCAETIISINQFDTIHHYKSLGSCNYAQYISISSTFFYCLCTHRPHVIIT